jgi:hypothetical protein
MYRIRLMMYRIPVVLVGLRFFIFGFCILLLGPMRPDIIMGGIAVRQHEFRYRVTWHSIYP